MIVKCKYCLPETGIAVPEFSSSEKNSLVDVNKQSPMQAILWIKDKFKLSLQAAKYIVMHINTNYGHCNRCAYDTLKGENINCPECGAFNFNW